MERGREGLLGQMAGAMAPRAPQPGRGTGNIPYAGGMTSGQFGRQGSPPPPQPTTPVPEPASPPGSAPSPSGGQPPSTAAPPMAAEQQSPFLDRMFYFEVMASIMTALTSAAESDGGYY